MRIITGVASLAKILMWVLVGMCSGAKGAVPAYHISVVNTASPVVSTNRSACIK
jgi:hypothetical protein